MQETPSSSYCVRFGVFEVDLRSGELRKAGSRVPLQEQPFRILARLLQRPGELITREELRQELWSGDTFVDFEHGLNAAVKRLRDALGDSAETPRFIETLPRRGYRFVAPVATTPESVAVEGDTVTVPGRGQWRSRRRAIAGIAAVLSAAAVVLAWWATSRPALSSSDRIVLGDFENQTGDPVLSGTVRQAVAVKLSESRLLTLVSDQGTREVLQMMRRGSDDSLTPAAAREVCQRLGATAMITGTVTSLGSAYSIALNAALCSNGDVLGVEQVQAARKEDILQALDGVTGRLRRRLGESLAAIDAANTPLERATTSSFEALKAFTEGERRFYAGEQREAVQFYKRATELDAEFAMAHAKLAIAYGNLGAPQGPDSLTRAFELRSRLTERERFYVAAHYHRIVRGDPERAHPIYEMWKSAYPEDPTPYGALGFLYVSRGEHDRALAEFRQAAHLSPIGFNYLNLAEMYVYVGALEEARAVVAEWERRIGATGFIHYPRFLLAFHARDSAGMERHALALRHGPDYDIEHMLGQAHAFFGRMVRARSHYAAAIMRDDAPEYVLRGALLRLELANWEAETGNCGSARNLVDEAWRLRERPFIRLMRAAVVAACGESDRAELLIKDASASGPIAAGVRARIDLSRGLEVRALERLAHFQNRDLVGRFGYEVATSLSHGLMNVYLRGRAQMARGNGREAAVEFQKILDHPGMASFAPYHALAPLYLARAHALAGAVEASRAAYERFFSLWKDADANIPVLRAAQAEYARRFTSRAGRPTH